MSNPEEAVLCFPRSAIPESKWLPGFLGSRFLDLVPPGVMRSLPRRLVEGDHRFKQVVTYCMVRVGSKFDARFLSYSRFKSGDEKRLHDRRSIGVGGHVSGEVCSSVGEVLKYRIEQEMVREIREEISIDRVCDLGLIGVVNDDSDDVGRDHVGLVYLCSVPEDASIIAIEDCLADLRFLSRDELIRTADEYESWSQILIREEI